MSAAAPGLSDRFAGILDALRRKLAVRAAKDRAFAPLLLILWNRISRTIARFAALAARQQAGTLRKPPQPRGPRAGADRPPSPRDPLPRQRGWLLRLAPEARVYANHLRLLLEESEMQALLQAAPQAGRLLRPLCRMLAIQPPPALQPPAPRPRARPKPASPAPAPRKLKAREPAARRPLLPAWVPRLKRPPG